MIKFYYVELPAHIQTAVVFDDNVIKIYINCALDEETKSKLKKEYLEEFE